MLKILLFLCTLQLRYHSIYQHFNQYRSRFYIVLYDVDAPISLRYNRFKEKYQKIKEFSMEEFIALDDQVFIFLKLFNYMFI